MCDPARARFPQARVMAGKRPPRAPARLADAGKALWRDVVAVYVLTAPELRLLKAVCATADTLEELEAVVAAEGVTTAGSKGQTVAHPAVAEARQQRLAFARLIAQLALPDPAGGVVRNPEQVRAQRAAQARWRATRRGEQEAG